MVEDHGLARLVRVLRRTSPTWSASLCIWDEDEEPKYFDATPEAFESAILAEATREWDTPKYKAIEQRILDHLGRQYFFSIDEPDRKTVAPDFGLPSRDKSV